MWREQLERVRSAGARAIALSGVSLALFAGGAWELGQRTQASDGLDFFQFWALGRHLAAAEVEDLYSEAAAAQAWSLGNRLVRESGSERGQRAAAWSRQLYANGVKPISTPWYYVTFALLPSGDFDRDVLVFQWASNLLLGGALLWLAVALGAGWPLALGALGAALWWFGPIYADVEVANMNRLQCGAVVAAALVFTRWPRPVGWVCGGFAIGLVVLFKPSLFALPLFLWIVWFAAGRRSALLYGAGGMAGAALLCVATSWAVFGSLLPWLQWLTALSEFQSSPLPIEHMNLSTARLLHEWTGRDLTLLLLPGLLASFGAAAWIGRGVRSSEGRLRSDVAAIAAGGVLPLIGTQLAWDHYWVLALPAIWLLLAPARSRDFDANRIARLALAALLFVFCAHRPLIAAFGLEAASQLAAWLVPANLLLWLVLLAELARQPGAGSATTNT